MSDTTEPPKARGRPRTSAGSKPVLVLLSFEQSRDLSILRQVMEGNPPVVGLIRTAIANYLAEKLSDPVISARYHNELNRPGLKLVD